MTKGDRRAARLLTEPLLLSPLLSLTVYFETRHHNFLPTHPSIFLLLLRALRVSNLFAKLSTSVKYTITVTIQRLLHELPTIAFRR